MAARVFSKAEGRKICLSSSVHDMCSGKSYSFTKKSDYESKGFDNLVPIFLVRTVHRAGAHATSLAGPTSGGAINYGIFSLG